MFYLGFVKVAYDGANNQGMEFQNSDTNNSTANVGPGGMAPQGFETYEPTAKKTAIQASKKKAKPLNEEETAQFLTAKYASKVDNKSSMSVSRAADGVSEGLKKDQETTNSTFADVFAARKAEKEEHSSYVKASLK